MKSKDWECPMCGYEMIPAGTWPYMTCPTGHGKLHPRWFVGDLPFANRIDYKRFTIADEDGFWQYVPHAGLGCMDRAPEKGTIVAKVSWNRSLARRAMVMKPCKPPRGGAVKKAVIPLSFLKHARGDAA